MTNTDVPGGALPTAPDSVSFATVVEDGEMLGSLWIAQVPVAGAVNAGCTTHHTDVPPRLSWLAQGMRIALDRGMDPADVWAEVRSLCGTRWTLGTVTDAPTLQEARYKSAEVAHAHKDKPAAKKPTKAKAKTTQEEPS